MEQAKAKASKPLKSRSGLFTHDFLLNHSSSDKAGTFERSFSERQPRVVRKTPSLNGLTNLPNRASANSLSAPIKASTGYVDSLDDKSKANMVQIKGRFSVTSKNFDLAKDVPSSTTPRRSPQGSPLRQSSNVEWTLEPPTPTAQSFKELSNSSFPASLIVPQLQNLFQQTSIQMDLIRSIMSSLQPVETGFGSQDEKLPPVPRSPVSENNGNVEPVASEIERLLLIKISELQARIKGMTEELDTEILKQAHLEEQLTSLTGQAC